MSTPAVALTGTAPTVTFTKTRPGGTSANPTTEYSALLRVVREAGLLRRRTGFYWMMFGLNTLALGGVVTGFLLLGDTWYQLLMAGALGIILTQYAFLAHEASHRQVFESGKANDLAGRTLANLFVGISYSWWMNKHSLHHANPNKIGKDPDIVLEDELIEVIGNMPMSTLANFGGMSLDHDALDQTTADWQQQHAAL